MLFDASREMASACDSGTCVRVSGTYERHPRHGAQITLSHIEPADPGEYDLDDLLDGPLRPVDEMVADLRDLIAQVRSLHLRALLDRVLGRRRADVAGVPRRPGRQALPPGLPARAARALAERRRRRSP